VPSTVDVIVNGLRITVVVTGTTLVEVDVAV
jgi:hypothetical protein